MKKALLYFFLVIPILVGGWFYFSAAISSEAVAPWVQNDNEDSFLPWVEVVNSEVVVNKSNELIDHPLKNGDTLRVGDTLESGKAGRVELYFPDGSVLRLDKDSSVTIKEFVFNQETGSLGVKLFLQKGQAWSKVLSLGSASSFWEIYTDNTIISSREGAFGVEYVADRTFVLVTEKSVTVNATDLDNKMPLINTAVVMDEGNFIQISNSDTVSLKNKSAGLVDMIKPNRPLYFERDWVKYSVNRDSQINNMLRELRHGGLAESSVKEQFVKEIYQKQKIESENSIKKIVD